MKKMDLFLPFVILGFLLCTAGPCIAVDGQIRIAQTAGTVFPIIIKNSGSYVLTTNLKVTDPGRHGIVIKTNDVTLDLNGHTIQGPGPDLETPTAGVVAKNRYTITIRNGKVWGFGGEGIRIDNNELHSGSGHIIEGVQCPNNGDTGIIISGGLLSNSTAYNNRYSGIISQNSTVVNCTVTNNGHYGIYSERSTISNCTIHSNGDHGIRAYNSTITDCSFQWNHGYGVYCGNDNMVKGCNARDNGDYGFFLLENGRNYVYRNVASGNKLNQFFCSGGNLCTDNASW